MEKKDKPDIHVEDLEFREWIGMNYPLEQFPESVREELSLLRSNLPVIRGIIAKRQESEQGKGAFLVNTLKEIASLNT